MTRFFIAIAAIRLLMMDPDTATGSMVATAPVVAGQLA